MPAGVCQHYTDEYCSWSACEAGSADEYVFCRYSAEASGGAKCYCDNNEYASECL